MYQKYHNNNNSKCVTFLTHYNDFPSYTLEKYKKIANFEEGKKVHKIHTLMISVMLEKTQ